MTTSSRRAPVLCRTSSSPRRSIQYNGPVFDRRTWFEFAVAAGVECGFDILRQGGVVDNKAEFRIQLARTWIEIERATEKARAVY